MIEIVTYKESIKTIIDGLYSINKSIDHSFDLLFDSIPKTRNIYKVQDTRSVTLINARETVNQLILAYTLMQDTLFNKSWVDEQKHFIIPKDNPHYIHDRIYTMGVFLDSSFLMHLFSEIESYFRDIYRVIPNSDTGKTKISDSFYKIRDTVYSHFNINQNSKDLLKILNYLRNSFHYSGHHFGKDETIEFAGVSYSFIQWEPIKINPLKFVIDYKNDIFSIINEINCSQVSRSFDFIPNAVSKVKFVQYG